MDMSNITTVAGITIICYLLAQVVKTTPLNSKYIPIFCGVAGAILGVVGLFVMPDFPVSNYIDAIAVGIVSGLGATGAHQVFKQLSGSSSSGSTTVTEEYESIETEV